MKPVQTETIREEITHETDGGGGGGGLDYAVTGSVDGEEGS